MVEGATSRDGRRGRSLQKRLPRCPASSSHRPHRLHQGNEAVGHSVLVACWHILAEHIPYRNLGEDWFVKRRPQARARRLARQIEALGFTVTIAPSEAA